MNKSELIAELAASSQVTKKAASTMLDSLIKIIKDEVAKGERVQIVDFGCFTPKQRKERTARNPKTGEPVQVPAQQIVTFEVGSEFKRLVKEGGV